MRKKANPYRKKARILSVGFFFTAFCLFFLSVVINLQFSGRAVFAVPKGGSERTVTLPAARGEIFDRNGKKLAENIYSYDLILTADTMPKENDSINEALDELAALLASRDLLNESLPAFEPDVAFLAFVGREEGNEPGEDEFGALLKEAFSVSDSLRFPDEVAFFRYAMKTNGFSVFQPYTVLSGIDASLIAALTETKPVGAVISKKVSRVYPFAGYASHLLGNVGLIRAEELEYYTALGYPMDATVGISGIEKAFESLLHGTDGQVKQTLDAEGRVIAENVVTEPIPGQDVTLTIDIDLQMLAEDSLAETVNMIRRNGEASGKEKNGADCRSGAIVVLEPETNGVLVAASYPTFDLNSYFSDYSLLLTDPDNPLYNRAFLGTFAPGSLFKPAVATAAIESGVVTPNEKIFDKGTYTFYEDYQPHCWYYTSYGIGHGDQNVTDAIRNSCNYYFYEVGRRLGIERMNAFTSHFGFGQSTGIELSESRGILAGPASREVTALGTWNPGDTLQAAIGQIENAFSPLQMAVYLSTLVDGGVRYPAHLFDHSSLYLDREPITSFDGSPIDSVAVSPSTTELIKNAMKSVMEDGTASRLFADYPISVGGKTGTAQTSKTASNNAVFGAFAPLEKPELTAVCVIERGVNGTDAGIPVKAVFDAYFGLDPEK